MKPVRDVQGTLVDLLDRILDKGLILDADIIIHVAGIPLVGVKLTAAVAGIETMLDYGIWRDWDEAQRRIAAEGYNQGTCPALGGGTEALQPAFIERSYSCDDSVQ